MDVVGGQFTAADGAAGAQSERHAARPGHGAEAFQKYPQHLARLRLGLLNRKNARLLDHDAVVTAILLGNHRRLRRAALVGDRARPDACCRRRMSMAA